MTKAMIQERERALRFLLATRAATQCSSQFTTAALLKDFKLYREGNLSNRTVSLAFQEFERTRVPGTWSTFSFHDRLSKSLSRLEQQGYLVYLTNQKVATWRIVWGKI